MRARSEAEDRALHAARAALAARTPCSLAELGTLDEPGFEILLDAIGEAFAHMGPEEHSGEATTADGGMAVKISLPISRAESATVRTPEGALRGLDIHLTLRLTDEAPVA